jgi:hypothetical protein
MKIPRTGVVYYKNFGAKNNAHTFSIATISRVTSHMHLNNSKIHNNDCYYSAERDLLVRLRMEAEARDSGEQLREMAEKVFQLLERLKLAELGNSS